MQSSNLLSIILALLGLLGSTPQFFGTNWKEIFQYYIKGIISWGLVHKTIKNVRQKLLEDKFEPDLIIGVGRGGILCAGILCSEVTGTDLVDSTKSSESSHSTKIRLESLNTTIFIRADVQRSKDDVTQKIERINIAEVDFDIPKNGKILLVMAQIFKGSTLAKALGKLQEKGIPRENVKTVAVFWHKHASVNVEHTPDIYGHVLPLGKTVPWKGYAVNTDRF